MELLKAQAASRLRFAVFRRFQTPDRDVEPGFDVRHRQIVMPVLGAFGTLAVPFNESLDTTPKGVNPDTEVINAPAGDVVRFAGKTWALEAWELIATSDVAVFHWGATLSDSMMLEFRLAERILGPRRMILVVDEDAGALMELCKQGLNLSMRVVGVKEGYGAFLAGVRDALRTMSQAPVSAVARQPRWSHSAWRFLHAVAERHADAVVATGRWRLPESLGGSECELILAAGHLMGRGRDAGGWFFLEGHYETSEASIQIDATQHYLLGASQEYVGTMVDPARIHVRVVGRADGDLVQVPW